MNEYQLGPADVVDMEKITNSVRSYAPPSDGLGSPYAIDATDAGVSPRLLTDLMEAIYGRGHDVEKCVFYLSPKNYNDLIQREDMMHVGVSSGAFKGREIRVNHTMPDSAVLFMAPDAVGLGGRVYFPKMVAYADL